MEDASLAHPSNWCLGLCCQLTLVPAGPGPAMVPAGPEPAMVPGLVVLPILGQALRGWDCLPLCVRVWCVQRGLNLSWGLWALP